MFSIYNHGVLAQPFSNITGKLYLVFEDGERVHLRNGAALLFRSYLNNFDIVLDDSAQYSLSTLSTLAVGGDNEDYPWSSDYEIDQIEEWFPEVFEKWLEDQRWNDGPELQQWGGGSWRDHWRYSSSLRSYVSESAYNALVDALGDHVRGQYEAGDLVVGIQQHVGFGVNDDVDHALLSQYLEATDYREWLKEWAHHTADSSAYQLAVDLDYILNGEMAQNALATAVEQHPIGYELLYSLDDYEVRRVTRVIYEEIDHPVFGPTRIEINLDDYAECIITPTRFEALVD